MVRQRSSRTGLIGSPSELHEEFESAHRRTAEAPFIRYRLNGWTKVENSWLGAGVFEALGSDRRLEPGERVVLGFDGSYAADSTALVACTVDEPRHLEIIGLWEKPDDQSAMGWRTPVHEVYAEIVDGLTSGQRYVVRGAFTLKAQLGKGSFGDAHGH